MGITVVCDYPREERGGPRVSAQTGRKQLFEGQLAS